MDFKEKVAELFLSIEKEMTMDEVVQMIEIPPNQDMGDYAVPCFKFAKKYRKSPAVIAAGIVEKIGRHEEFDKIESAGPYVNFFVDKAHFAEKILKQAFKEYKKYGSTNIGEGKTVIVEFSSPNIAKPFHIGHIRSTLIGNSIHKIYTYLGYNTIAINHLGDYGTQFGMLISAYKKWGNTEVVEAIEKNPIPELLKLYVRYNKEIETYPEYRDEARYWFKELENGNEEAHKLWSWFREVSLKEFNRVYNMFGIKYDSFT
ncbi:MAG: arginine--tRNA ligase, partial [Tissierellia bacterium]|nr:arginine--tRNA ligase [Tissierellia bacterium]